jgi:hypothetical protein
MRLLAAAFQKVPGLKGAGRWLEKKAPTAPRDVIDFLTKDRTGGRVGYIIPKKTQKAIIDPLAKDPMPFALAALPGTLPTGIPLGYLGLREGAGKALGIRGAGRPGINLIPEFVRNPTWSKNPFTHLQKRFPEATKRLKESKRIDYWTSPASPNRSAAGEVLYQPPAKTRLVTPAPKVSIDPSATPSPEVSKAVARLQRLSAAADRTSNAATWGSLLSKLL